jgi:hypothetical protein
MFKRTLFATLADEWIVSYGTSSGDLIGVKGMTMTLDNDYFIVPSAINNPDYQSGV